MDEERPLLQQETNDEQNGITDSQTKVSKEKGAIDKIAFLALVIGVFISMTCESFVTTTHEQIASSFNALPLGSWLLTSYAMGYSMILPLYGNLIDMYGCKNMLIFAYCTFTIGCIMTGCGPTIYTVLAGRFITSLGGAGMVDTVSILLNNTTTLAQVVVLRNYLNIGMTLGVSCGAPLGGFLTDIIGWRWSFLIQAPVALLCMVTVAIRLQADSPRDTSNPDHSWFAELSKIDYLGYILQVSSICCGVYVLYLVQNRSDGQLPLEITAGVGFIILLGLLVTAELFTKKAPVFPVRDMVKDGIGLICLGQILLNFCTFAITSNVSGFFIYTENATNAAASFPLVICAIGGLVGSFGAAFFVQRFKKCKIPSLVGAFVTFAGSILIFFRWRYAHLRWEVAYIILLCTGLGGMSSSQYIALASRTAGKSASIVTTYHVCQQIGTIVGSAYPVGLLLRLFRDQLLKAFGDGPEAQKTIQRLLENSRFAFTLPAAMQDLVLSSFLKTFPVIPALSSLSMIVFILSETRREDILME